MKLNFVTIAAALCLVGTSVHAGPIVGTIANGQLSAPCCGTLLNQNQGVIDPGVEFSVTGGGNAVASADLSDTSVTLSFFTASSVAIGDDLIWSFTLDPSIQILAISELSDNFLNGANLISFSGNTASFRILNQFHGSQQTFSAVYSISAVPEPGTLALLGLGLAGLAATRRRKQ